MAKIAKAKALPDVADLTKAQAKVEHMRLALELEGHDKRYYQDDAPSVSDAEYDTLRQRFNRPTPTIEPARVCVVLTGTPRNTVNVSVPAADASAQKPSTGRR